MPANIEYLSINDLIDIPPKGSDENNLEITFHSAHAPNQQSMAFIGGTVDEDAAILLVKDGETWGNSYFMDSDMEDILNALNFHSFFFLVSVVIS